MRQWFRVEEPDANPLLVVGRPVRNIDPPRGAFYRRRPVITPEQGRELQGLIEETGTELERVLAYYRVSALSEMTEGSYRRALEVLNRKLAKQSSQENGTHAQN
jgi:hypothetical protein